MQDFSVHIDHKVTIWERCKWNIQAETEAEAKEIAKKIWDDQEAAYEREDYLGVDYIADTTEYLTPEENNGSATEELMLDGSLIHSNVQTWQPM